LDDAVSIVLAVVIVSTVGFVQEYRFETMKSHIMFRSEQSVQALTQFVAHKCQVIRSGRPLELLAEELVKGDIVALNRYYCSLLSHLFSGDRIPADIRLIETIEMRVDESILTGEAIPAKKHTRPIEDYAQLSIAERVNMTFMGTILSQGKGKGVVVATGDDTELGKIGQIIKNTSSHKTPLQLKMDQLGQHLTILSFVSSSFTQFL
jgi:Ca2+-transporting ATPase